jgi:hypothetical protein
LCGPCRGAEGFCRECVEKHKAVNQLKQLRSAIASRATVGASTTARLKLAIQQAGPQANQRPAAAAKPQRPPSAPTAPLMGTRPLDLGLGMNMAISPSLSRKLPPLEHVPQPRRYNAESVAYQPVVQRTVEPRPATPKRPAAKKAAATARTNETKPGWVMPFAAGLGAGIVLVTLLLVSQSFLQPRISRPKAKPAHQQSLTTQEIATAKSLLGEKEAAPLVSLSQGARVDQTPQVGWAGD